MATKSYVVGDKVFAGPSAPSLQPSPGVIVAVHTNDGIITYNVRLTQNNAEQWFPANQVFDLTPQNRDRFRRPGDGNFMIAYEDTLADDLSENVQPVVDDVPAPEDQRAIEPEQLEDTREQNADVQSLSDDNEEQPTISSNFAKSVPNLSNLRQTSARLKRIMSKPNLVAETKTKLRALGKSNPAKGSRPDLAMSRAALTAKCHENSALQKKLTPNQVKEAEARKKLQEKDAEDAKKGKGGGVKKPEVVVDKATKERFEKQMTREEKNRVRQQEVRKNERLDRQKEEELDEVDKDFDEYVWENKRLLNMEMVTKDYKPDSNYVQRLSEKQINTIQRSIPKSWKFEAGGAPNSRSMYKIRYKKIADNRRKILLELEALGKEFEHPPKKIKPREKNRTAAEILNNPDVLVKDDNIRRMLKEELKHPGVLADLRDTEFQGERIGRIPDKPSDKRGSFYNKSNFDAIMGNIGRKDPDLQIPLGGSSPPCSSPPKSPSPKPCLPCKPKAIDSGLTIGFCPPPSSTSRETQIFGPPRFNKFTQIQVRVDHKCISVSPECEEVGVSCNIVPYCCTCRHRMSDKCYWLPPNPKTFGIETIKTKNYHEVLDYLVVKRGTCYKLPKKLIETQEDINKRIKQALDNIACEIGVIMTDVDKVDGVEWNMRLKRGSEDDKDEVRMDVPAAVNDSLDYFNQQSRLSLVEKMMVRDSNINLKAFSLATLVNWFNSVWSRMVEETRGKLVDIRNVVQALQKDMSKILNSQRSGPRYPPAQDVCPQPTGGNALQRKLATGEPFLIEEHLIKTTHPVFKRLVGHMSNEGYPSSTAMVLLYEDLLSFTPGQMITDLALMETAKILVESTEIPTFVQPTWVLSLFADSLNVADVQSQFNEIKSFCDAFPNGIIIFLVALKNYGNHYVTVDVKTTTQDIQIYDPFQPKEMLMDYGLKQSALAKFQSNKIIEPRTEVASELGRLLQAVKMLMELATQIPWTTTTPDWPYDMKFTADDMMPKQTDFVSCGFYVLAHVENKSKSIMVGDIPEQFYNLEHMMNHEIRLRYMKLLMASLAAVKELPVCRPRSTVTEPGGEDLLLLPSEEASKDKELRLTIGHVRAVADILTVGAVWGNDQDNFRLDDYEYETMLNIVATAIVDVQSPLPPNIHVRIPFDDARPFIEELLFRTDDDKNPIVNVEKIWDFLNLVNFITAWS